ncbi:SDR family NAD(P)-dependent oxidoreductase [bacterium]|nr:SDR family NAD(P)-dependent oxidoreductase [bacterium]
MNIKDKTAIITGAGRGIGRAVALALAREGANLVLASRSKKELDSAADEVRACGVKAVVMPTDMRNEEQVRAMVQASVKEFGALHVLINNAGLGYFKTAAELKTSEWDEMFSVNLRGVFIATQAAIPHLRSAKESFVINIASLAGKNTFVGGSGYAATKWGLRAFSQCLMLEERQHGIRVLAVCPGSVDTSFSAHSAKKDIIRPEDVADTIIMALRMPQRSMVSEIDIRPTNP